MKKTIKLKENDIHKLVEKIMNESNVGFKGGFAFSGFIDNELLQDVIDRMNHLYCEGCGEEYKEALKQFNSGWTIDPKRSRRM